MMNEDCHESYQFVSHVLQYERITVYFQNCWYITRQQ